MGLWDFVTLVNLDLATFELGDFWTLGLLECWTLQRPLFNFQISMRGIQFSISWLFPRLSMSDFRLSSCLSQFSASCAIVKVLRSNFDVHLLTRECRCVGCYCPYSFSNVLAPVFHCPSRIVKYSFSMSVFIPRFTIVCFPFPNAQLRTPTQFLTTQMGNA